MKQTYIIDGEKFSDLEGFYNEVSAVMLTEGIWWGRNLDAFNDVLRGGWGTPDEGLVFHWSNSAKSRTHLGQAAFDTLVEIIQDHGEDGNQSRDNVSLILDYLPTYIACRLFQYSTLSVYESDQDLLALSVCCVTLR